MNAIRRVLEQQRAAGFEAFSGAVVHMTLPLTDRVLNQAIRERLRAEVRVTILEGNQVDVAFRGPWWLPFSAVRLQVEEEILIEPSPTVRLRLVSPAALAGRAAGAVASTLGLLPAAVRIAGSEIRVDIGSLMTKRGHGDIATLLAAGSLHTVAGTLTLSATLRVA